MRFRALPPVCLPVKPTPLVKDIDPRDGTLKPVYRLFKDRLGRVFPIFRQSIGKYRMRRY